MVIRPEPVVKSLEDLETTTLNCSVHRILISPQGKVFNQQKAVELSKIDQPIALICGRFEGFDERIRHYVNEEISLGDFVMMGGEVAAMAIIETVGRLIPGVIGNQESLIHESFSNGLLEYSQYTRPVSYRGMKVPDVLRSGNHQEIRNWRKADALRRTNERRIDLVKS